MGGDFSYWCCLWVKDYITNFHIALHGQKLQSQAKTERN